VTILTSVRTTRVLVVHRHRIFAETLARRLGGEPGIRPVGIASTPAAARAAVDSLGPHAAVLDMDLDNGAGFYLAAELAHHEPPIRVLAILGNNSHAATTRAIRAGADAVTTSDGSAADLVNAVLALARDHCWVPERLLDDVLREVRSSLPPPNEYAKKLARLTSRERDILDRMVSGWDRTTIADELGVSVNTVRTHAQNLLTKLEVHSSLEAVSVARQAGRGDPH
jgi:DNA-binding NarL/FixJ family response regulator